MKEIALIEPYELHSGIGAFTSGLYPELEENGADLVKLESKKVPVLQTTFDINFGIPQQLKRVSKEYDLVFIPSHTLLAGFRPSKADSEVAVMVHDLEKYPSRQGSLISRFNRNRSVSKLKQCDYVFAPSEATRLDLLKYTDVGVENTFVIGEGVETIEERQEVDIEDFFLYVGGMQERKNVDTLVKAFSQYKGDESLVLAGRVYNERNRQRIRKLAEDLGVEESVHFLGEVSKPELAYLYENTAGYIHPAYFEGFGRPPVEAAAYGAPTSVVKGTAPAEYLKNAYKMAPNKKGIVQGFDKLIESPELHQEDFELEWKNTAEMFIQAIGGIE